MRYLWTRALQFSINISGSGRDAAAVEAVAVAAAAIKVEDAFIDDAGARSSPEAGPLQKYLRGAGFDSTDEEAPKPGLCHTIE